jgi:hypothetical protein
MDRQKDRTRAAAKAFSFPNREFRPDTAICHFLRESRLAGKWLEIWTYDD